MFCSHSIGSCTLLYGYTDVEQQSCKLYVCVCVGTTVWYDSTVRVNSDGHHNVV